ncbi:conserved hypothetical protein [Segniliparus rotundus DSM 44985]|uniref:Uncharacterized protein n=1 Tax=Segniliparus rotundus (strain ATCC BAA-972 / CDC 1076 / CIP 108378 / DSM 44985 / JCM 13578) TaxID=640132 RepID=D6ZCL3_SEGRD|nr:hypothetical protein [Segniliparus rotundus]ADG97055.1 conserved hypothetical protein [Segniliparus rotundus DSM 44985]
MPSERFAASWWTLGFGGAMILQGVFRKQFAEHTFWGYNGGWQREIAVWNLGTVVTALSLAKEPEAPARAQVRGYAVLSALFAVNHLAAAARSPRSWGHWAAAGANAAGLAVGLPALLRARKAS